MIRGYGTNLLWFQCVAFLVGSYQEVPLRSALLAPLIGNAPLGEHGVYTYDNRAAPESTKVLL